MPDGLRDPIAYPNWVWLLGAALIIAAALWVGALLLAYRFSAAPPHEPVRRLSDARRERYRHLLDEIRGEYQAGELSTRDAHLALSALIRSAASERLATNVESVSVQDAHTRFGQWPLLAEALTWCEEPSFGLRPQQRAARMDIGFDYAEQVVNQ